MNQPTKTRTEYQTPQLEEQASYTLTTGISIPINVFQSTDPLIEESLRLAGDK